MRKSFKVNFHANAGWWPEPRYQGWTSKEWQEWISEPAGSTWCENKRYEADWIADWMIRHWGKSCLQKGVLDVGGEPGFLAAALLSRGISVTVVDPTWGITGKDHWSNDCVAPAYETGAKLTVFNKEFNQRFLVEHPEIWQIAVVASLYGDEATIPALSFAVDAQKPSAIVPCNECAHFFPEYDKSYEGYCQALLQDAWWRGGHFDVVFMEGQGRANCRTEAEALPSKEVFRCEGLQEAVNDMRRRVQAAMALDLIAAPYAKVLGNHFDPENFLSASEQLMADSNFVLVLHAGAIWWYHCFLRDHLVARHVTSISWARPAGESTFAAIIETGPWTRQVQLSSSQAQGATTVSLRQMFATGALYMYRESGTILDETAVQDLCQSDIYPISEELHTNAAAKAAMHIGLHEPAGLVVEDSEGTLNRLEASWLQRPLQWHGRSFGNLSLAMGITSVIIWMNRTLQQPGVPFSRSLLVQGPKGFQAPVPRPSGFMKASEWERQTLAEEQARRSKGQTRPPCQF
eukprot:symbB.v1.2.018704.t2/scaffold1502.1/size115091/1